MGKERAECEGSGCLFESLAQPQVIHLNTGIVEQEDVRAEDQHHSHGLEAWAWWLWEGGTSSTGGELLRVSQQWDHICPILHSCWKRGRGDTWRSGWRHPEGVALLAWSLWLFKEPCVSQLCNGDCGRWFGFVFLWERSCQAIILHPVALQTCLFKSNLLPHNWENVFYIKKKSFEKALQA